MTRAGMTLTYAGSAYRYDSVLVLQSFMDTCVLIVLIGCITCIIVVTIQTRWRKRELDRREKELEKREKELDKWQL